MSERKSKGKITTVSIPDEVRGYWNSRGISMASVMRMSAQWHEDAIRMREGIRAKDEKILSLCNERDRLIDENRDLRGFKARILDEWRMKGVKGHEGR